ncbi:MAG: hypothetical protein E5Y73_30155 [Mesorhizobium sp.]|uniref:hypothetical protein n=1 Tax=Mesorhizobium sp. TaxID=1871066 RepID=UPI00120C9359|nr:hypothetical protein [Mesorhizobium sp.]TIL85171.1 MAG: hypothetical protein E5Y73_30155 [Mesorhizobium sp.]
MPAAYIWVPPILTITSSHIEYWDTVTKTTAKMSARLRFARPLVPDSTWTMRKLYANGKLIYDGSVGYRQKGLKFNVYDGRSTQPRDPTMVREEGEENVSAHRGYLDIVVVDFDIIGLGAPPVFEAEWIQDGATTHDYDNFTTLSSGAVNHIVPVWEDLLFFGYTEPGSSVRQFSLGALREYFSIPQDEFSFLFHGWRYSRNLNLLIYMGQSGSGFWKPYLTSPTSSGIIATGANVGSVAAVIGTVCLIDGPSNALYVGFTDDQQLFVYLADASSLLQTFDSGVAWGGYTKFECLTPGEVRGSEFDVWLCADSDLVKLTFTSQGAFKSTTVVATFTDDLRYAVYDDGDLVVWTDAATVKRVNGTTGAIEFTKSVPYQIETYSSRELGDPDLQRLTNELYFVASSTSYFTNLQTGETRSISGATSNPQTFYYDGQTDTILTKTGLSVPQRLRIISADGTQRQLSDFLEALMEAGGFESSEIDTINIDDVIDGAVIDVTAGVRDIARSVCEPYSIAVFERAGKIIFKRAFTDGAFAIDATISAAGDVAESG